MKPENLTNGTMALILGSALAAATALAGSLPAAADSHGMGKKAGYGEHHGQGGHPTWCEHHGGGKHPGHGSCHGQGKSRLFGPSWKTSVSPEQQAALDRLHVAYAKAKMPLKAQAKAIKLELTALALQDEPDTGAINAKIDELLALKRTMMIGKYEYVAAQRKLLTPEQRVSFDLDVIKHSKYRQKGKRGH